MSNGLEIVVEMDGGDGERDARHQGNAHQQEQKP